MDLIQEEKSFHSRGLSAAESFETPITLIRGADAGFRVQRQEIESSAIRLGSYWCQRGQSSLGSTCDSLCAAVYTQVSSAGTHVTKRVLLHFSRSRLVVDRRSSLDSLRFSDLNCNPKSHRWHQKEFSGNSYSFAFGSSGVSTWQESESPHISEPWAFNAYSKDLIPDLVRIVNLLKYIRLLDSNVTCRVWNELSFKPSV